MNPAPVLNYTAFKAPLFFAWQLTSVCNLGCLHCCEESGHIMPDELKGKEVLNVCRQIINLKIPYVAISGGEPMLHPDFFAVCELLRKAQINLKVETNGLFIDREKARRFARLMFRSVQVSLDGATKEAHERLRENGDWEKTVQATKLLVKAGVNTEIVFVPTKFNYAEIGDLIDLAYSLGIYGVYTGKIMRIGRAALNWERLCPSDEEYKVLFNILEKKSHQYNGKMKIFYYPYDVIEELKYRLKYPAASLLVIPNGKVKLIGPLPFVCADLKKHSLKEAWERYKLAWKNPEVLSFAQKVIRDPRLLAQSNRWRELDS
jgi:MoaA/NifB/PqqE/SkfB family radical SAM enzyme